ncbi:nuclease-related domain-containing protein [Halobacillus salinus]|uniref:NERD domain-containing protein n=1 Tax=Halobacillus salinus TaxID=192814 RepID=A0A4Z0GYF4_9BACI|nr:nuclease-related domain-containing protein [Halobacillus salinus]TGB02251.1 NERD domain-containing protein [Halobacillus salinus]
MSISIERLRSLLDRLSPDHHLLPAVEQAYGIKKSGMNGEASLDYHLHFIDGDFQVLNGIRLQGDLYIFQMDVVLVTRSRIFLIEVKNYAGELIYDGDNHQMLQIVDGQQKAYADPILQAKRQTVQLRKWISQQTLPSIPISALVVFTNSYASLDSPHPDVIKSSYLPFKVSNQQLCDFLRINDRQVANRILKSLGYKKVGSTSNSYYLIPTD